MYHEGHKISVLCITMTHQLQLASLNSGSNGNCYYIGNETEAVLIDAGISCRETVRRLDRLGLSIEKVKGIFITHEHTDHTRGVQVLSKKHGIPVFITPDTHKAGRLMIDLRHLNHFMAHQPIAIGDLLVHPLPKLHDGVDPHSFTVTFNDLTVGVFTDIGAACEHVVRHLRKCHAAFLEANYDAVMLDSGNYPLQLKRRIRGGKGHLSNKQALDIFTSFRSPDMKLLVLSHLSEHNNHPEIVRSLFSPYGSNGTRIEIASRHQESEVFVI